MQLGDEIITCMRLPAAFPGGAVAASDRWKSAREKEGEGEREKNYSVH